MLYFEYLQKKHESDIFVRNIYYSVLLHTKKASPIRLMISIQWQSLCHPPYTDANNLHSRTSTTYTTQWRHNLLPQLYQWMICDYTLSSCAMGHVMPTPTKSYHVLCSTSVLSITTGHQFTDQEMWKCKTSAPIVQRQVYFYQIADLTLYISDVAIIQNIVDHIVRFNTTH
jgi:hypothetical protein